LRDEIARDKTPLRVELRRDFEEVDQLTGLISKSEYLRFVPGLFHEVREAGEAITFLVMDMDHFKAVNDALGHAVGDEMLRTAARAILSTGREEDPAVRFGGDELIVIVRGDYEAGFKRAERIRSRFAEVIQGELAEKLGRVPSLMAQKELVEKKRQDPLHRGGLEELASRWKGLPVGTLSIGVAQGLGPQLQHPCADVSDLFRRADAMLYLAKEAGGNRTVVMVDPIEIPLTGNEFRELMEFWSGKGKPLATLEGYVDYRRSTGRPPTFGGYSYDGYLNPA
jgi:diguanylate cyclase (GGDEF)-like protein